ncbi:MAG: glycosyltransferase family 2 protein [Clostridia bacterium]|nr:glycosyltransferase family 2 protein [Clostridia bacterium]
MDTKNNSVSIIIPVYNRQEVVEECIRSVQLQSYSDFEIILIDDGSTDNTVEICQQIATKDKRIKILTSPHGGVSSARNAGLDAATGEYIFLDSDDIIHPKLLEVLVKELEEHHASITGTKSRNCMQQYWLKVKDVFYRIQHLPKLHTTSTMMLCGVSFTVNPPLT